MLFSRGPVTAPRFASSFAVSVFLLGWCGAALGQSAAGQTSPAIPDVSYTFAKSAEDYLASALSPENLVSSIAASATSSAFHSALHDFSTAQFQPRLAENLTRKGIAGSIDFVTASMLRQNTAFIPSADHGFVRRARYALLQTFIARGREGNAEFAASRIAASFGTAWVLDTWHPWFKHEPNVWDHAGFIFGSYTVRSFWTEFKPDIKHQLRTVFRRDTR